VTNEPTQAGRQVSESGVGYITEYDDSFVNSTDLFEAGIRCAVSIL